MKKMIRMAMMAAALFAVVTTTAKAQGGGGGGGGGGRGGRNPLTILKDSMHVSEAILAKADSIIKAAAAESAPLAEAARGGDADARTKMQAVTTKRNDAIKALLTDEQKAQYDKLMPAGRRGGGL